MTDDFKQCIIRVYTDACNKAMKIMREGGTIDQYKESDAFVLASAIHKVYPDIVDSLTKSDEKV